MHAFLLSLLLTTPPADTHALITRLGHDDFEVREAAQQKLLAGGWGQASLLRAATKHADLEVRTRARAIYWYLHKAEVQTFVPLPMIDALWYDPVKRRYLYDDECAIRHRFQTHLDAVGGGDNPPHTHYREASVLLFGAQLDDGAPRWLLRLQWGYMHVLDALWMRTCCPHARADMEETAVFAWQRWMIGE